MTAIWLTAQELAEAGLPGVPDTKRGVNMVAERDGWNVALAKDGSPLARRRAGRGGGWEYHISLLPESARAELVARAQPAEANGGPADAPAGDPPADDRARRRAEARSVIVRAYQRFVHEAGLPVEDGRAVFAQKYNAGEIAVPDWVRETVGRTSRNSLKNWEKHLRTEGPQRLAGNHGNRRGDTIIDRTPAMRDLVLGILHQYPHASSAHVLDAIRTRFDDGTHELPSARTVQRWLTQFRRNNRQVMAKATSPDDWKNRYAAAGGSMAERLTAPNELWELDSTKVDLILNDGRRHTLIAAIDVHTRRLRLVVDRTSRAAGIAALLRRCILDWGVPDTIKTDNGADYVSQHITGVLASLGIEQSLCPPFAPEKKPHVERAFKTFLHDLVELLPGYVGHDVAEREAIRARESFAARLMTKPETESDKVTLDSLSPAELQEICDRWCDDRYAHRPHGGLGQKTPFQVASEHTGRVRAIGDERALDVLLAAPIDGHGERTVRKKGIQVAGAWYDHPALGEHTGHRVTVRMDESDAAHIHVFDADGRFIAKAFAPEHSGMSRSELAAQRRANQRKTVNAGTAELRQAANRADVADIGREILAGDSRRAGKVAAFPKPSDSHETPATREAGKAARADEAPAPAPVSDRERQAHERVKADLTQRGPSQPAEPAPGTKEWRLAKGERIEAARANGEPVSDADAWWFDRYRDTPEWRTHVAMLASFGESYTKKEPAPNGTGQHFNGE